MMLSVPFFPPLLVSCAYVSVRLSFAQSGCQWLDSHVYLYYLCYD